ncbi:MAG: histidine kinase [Pseudomonadota bacterium]
MTLQKRLTNFGIALIAIWLAMDGYFLLQGISGLLTLHHYAFDVWGAIRSNTVYIWVPLLPLTPLVFWFASRYPLVPGKLRGALSRHLGMMTGFAFLHGYLSAMFYYHIGLIEEDMVEYEAWQHAGHYLFDNGVFLLDVLIYSLLVASQNISFFHKLVQQQELDAARMQSQLTESRLQTLKLQLNPHFLFNTLNGIAVLIDKNENERARNMVGELSSFLRQTLNNPKEKWVTLAKELEMVRQYLAIEQYRFGARLTYHEDCEPLALSAHIPPMLLQPLFENAIVHGLSNKQGACRLSFECKLYDRYLFILIFDNGDDFDETLDPLTKGGIGLGNIQARLRETYGDNYSLTIEKKPDGTLVTLKLPSYKDSQF